jgi:hypothetical protein
MLVMLVVHVRMGMLELLVLMPVRVPLAQLEPKPQP